MERMKSGYQSIPAPTDAGIYRPSKARFFAFRILMMIAAYQAGFTLFQMLSKALYGVTYPREAWLISSVAFIVVFSCSLYISNRNLTEDFAIVFYNGLVDGPSGMLNRRTHFPCERLDLARSRRLTPLNWLFQYRYLWSLDGQKIVLFTYAFPPQELDELLARLSL